MMLVISFEQIFLLYFDAGGRSLLIGDHLENCWLATSNSCIEVERVLKYSGYDITIVYRLHKYEYLCYKAKF